jgi:hypothetical protein
MLAMEPLIYPDQVTQIGDRPVRRNPKEINSKTKQDHVQDSGQNNPLPKAMIADKLVCSEIGLDGNYNFF